MKYIFILIIYLISLLIKAYPRIGKMLGIILVCIPCILLFNGVYDTSNYRSDGSPAALVIYVGLISISIVSLLIGFSLLIKSKDTKI